MTTAIAKCPDYKVSDPLGRIAGFTDYSLKEMSQFTTIHDKVVEVYKRYGFTPFDLRVVEYAENLQKKGGIEAQIFGLSQLRDGELTKIALRFDHTVSLALYVAQKANEIIFPLKRSDIGKVYRGETPGPGRYNEFYQADIDTVDTELTAADDAETIATLVSGLQAAGLPPKFTVLVNHVDLAKSILQERGIAPEYHAEALRVIDKLKPDNSDKVAQELSEAIPGFSLDQATALLESMRYCGPIQQYAQTGKVNEVAMRALNHLREVEECCTSMGVPKNTLQLSLSLARGLNYYTGTVFETVIQGRERLGSVASGGRYDNLVGDFDKRYTNLKGVGGCIGLTRLFDVMRAEDLLPTAGQTTAQVFVGYRTLNEFPTAVAVANTLRNEGYYVELYTGNKVRVKHELDLCGKKGIAFSVMVFNSDEIQVQAMQGGSHASPVEQRRRTCTGVEAVSSLLKVLATPEGEVNPQ